MGPGLCGVLQRSGRMFGSKNFRLTADRAYRVLALGWLYDGICTSVCLCRFRVAKGF